jgi:hypothetical protein
MESILLCILVALVAFGASLRSLVAGLGVVLTVGYFYGIVRANLVETGSHFLFDAAVAGLFMARLIVMKRSQSQPVSRELTWWVLALIAWPFMLLAVPRQDLMVQIVGFRGNAFLLPFLLIGAQLTDDRRYRLALWCAGLNIVAFGFAAAEFQLGIPRFFPKSAVTQIIYMSNDVGGEFNLRIPATFGSAHAYGGTMVMTLPLLLGAWLQERSPASHRALLMLAVMAASVGVFMSAARSHALLLFAFLVFATVAARMTMLARASWYTLLGMLSLLVAANARLQRFTTLADTSYVTERVGWSLNESFLKNALAYPMGNGLGGGGTSMPYFLAQRLTNRVVIENEYARIMLEQGIPGLLLWVVFIGWLLTRRSQGLDRGWRNARTLAWCVTVVSFGSALIGTGLLTSVPQSALFLMSAGWMASSVRKTATEDDEYPLSLPERAMRHARA